MRLDDYLEALRQCPDDRLKDEMGIYDNWPILLNAGFESVVENLRQSGSYRHVKTIEHINEEIGVVHSFESVDQNVKLAVADCIPPFFTTGFGYNNTERDRIESERQLRDYTMSIMLHPKNINLDHWARYLAKVVDDIGQLAMREKIPACMPRTIGKYIHDKDYSRIVYHQPETPALSHKVDSF